MTLRLDGRRREVDLERGALRARVLHALKGGERVQLTGPPGVGVRWVAARVSEDWRDDGGQVLPLCEAQPDELRGALLIYPAGAPCAWLESALVKDARVLFVGGDAHHDAQAMQVRRFSEEALRVLLTRWLKDQRQFTVTDSDINALVRRCEGLPGALVRATSRLRLLGPQRLLTALQRDGWSGHDPASEHPSMDALMDARLSHLTYEERKQLARLAIHERWPLADITDILGDLPVQFLSMLRDRGLVERADSGEVEIGGFVRRGARRSAPRSAADAEEALGRWGAERCERAEWHGDFDAAMALARFETAFRRLSVGWVKKEGTRLNALMALSTPIRVGVVERPHSSDDVHAALFDLVNRRPNATAASLLMCADGARVGGRGDVAELFLSRADGVDASGRVALVRARLRFVQGALHEAWDAAHVARRELIDTGDALGVDYATLVLSWIALGRSEFETAKQLGEEALERFTERGALLHAVRAAQNLALLELGLGRPSAALALLNAFVMPDGGRLAAASSSFRCLAYELSGELSSAMAHLSKALRSLVTGHSAAVFHGYRGRLQLAMHDLSAAQSNLTRSIDALSGLESWPSVSTFRALRAVCEGLQTLERGDELGADEDFEHATREASDILYRKEIVALCRWTLDFVARRRARLGEAQGFRLVDWEAGCLELVSNDAHQHLHLRTARACLRRVVLERENAAHLHNSLICGAEESVWRFRGQEIKLRQDEASARILLALTQAHPSAVGLVDDALVRAGWPNEQITETSRKNRLRVAVAKLRKLGARGAIERTDHGYRIPPAIRVLEDFGSVN